jgi:NDP-sugar pyrophosphorylase family protein
VPNPSLYGIAEIEPDGRIRNFKEKPAPDACFSNLANAGLYIIEPEAMKHVPNGEAFDFAKDLFPLSRAKRGLWVRG